MNPTAPHLDGYAYWVESPRVGALRPLQREDLSNDGSGPQLGLRTLYSGVSPGTECLVGNAEIPAEAQSFMACPGMRGHFALPIKYGYCCVAEVQMGPQEMIGRRAFLMHPHQSQIQVSLDRLQWIPDSIPSRRALLFPNLETAVNGVWDAPETTSSIADKESLLIFGAGLVGLLLHYVLANGGRGHRKDSSKATPRIIHIESDPGRRERAKALPWIEEVFSPTDLVAGEASVAWHTTGTASGLQAAIDAVGFEGAVVDLSWYGTRKLSLDLGSSFHWQRKRIISSQVAYVAPLMRESLGYAGRRARVWELLQSTDLDCLLSPDIPLADLPAYMMKLYAGDRPHSLPVISYQSPSL